MIADELFLLFEPLITMDSIQYANGTDGRQRRKLFDQSYSHQSIVDYYSTFQRVSIKELQVTCIKKNEMESKITE